MEMTQNCMKQQEKQHHYEHSLINATNDVEVKHLMI